MRPETVLRWHRRGWRVFWWWRSRRPMGRPRVPAEVRDLIAVMSRDNPLWGTERIRGELRKLGIAVSAGSIRRYRWRGPVRPPAQPCLAFFHTQAAQIWAADLSGSRTSAPLAVWSHRAHQAQGHATLPLGGTRLGRAWREAAWKRCGTPTAPGCGAW